MREGNEPMPEYRLVVCEDDKIVQDEICRACDSILTEEKIPHAITSFSSAEALEEVLYSQDRPFDLLVLDIELEGKSGLQLAREARARDDVLGILFVTGYEAYALHGYKARPVDFLLKPLDWDELKWAIMEDWKKNRCPRTVLLEQGRKKVRLDVRKILYVEPDGNHGAHIILESGSVRFPAGLNRMEQMLPKDQFIRCHNSCIVNLFHVRECTGQAFKMDDGERTLPISRKYHDSCQKAFISYINR